MSFIPAKGKVIFKSYPVTVSTAIAANALVAWSSGRLIAATSTTAPSSIAGVLVKAIAATDDDYATTRNVDVMVPAEPGVEWEATVTGTLVVADVGLYCDISDSVTVNRAASTYDVFQVTRFVSTTKAIGILNIGPYGISVIGA